MKPPRDLPRPPLLIITDRHMAADFETTVVAALEAGARWIMLREKDQAPVERLALARRLARRMTDYAGRLSINSDLSTALLVGAAGLHLPQDRSCRAVRSDPAVEKIMIGVSVHTPEQAQRAAAEGADYLLLASIFQTASKPLDYPPLGLAGLRAIADAVEVPVIALGGIMPETARPCLQAGAAGVAVMGAIMRAADPARVTRNFLQALS